MAEIHQVWIDGIERMYANELLDAIDLASDQGQRTWLVSGGKRIAMIVTVDDGERLERSEALCICSAGGWLDSCPIHGEIHKAADGGQWPVDQPVTHAHGQWKSHTHQPRHGSHEGAVVDPRWAVG